MTREKIIAALDIGSTAVALLVVKCLSDGTLEPINEYTAITRLGENLYNSGKLSEDAINKSVNAAVEMQAIAMNDGAQNLIVTASSIIRDAENRSKFLLKCHQAMGIYPQVLSGKEEARFAFQGAAMDIDDETPIFLINIGGGSSEIVYGTKKEIVNSYCLNFGGVKITEMFKLDAHRRSLLPSFSPPKQARNFIKKELQKKIGESIYPWLFKNEPVVLACGGSATSFAALLTKQVVYDRKQINYTESSRQEIMSYYKTLSKMDNKTRANLPGMEPERAGIMPAGLLILSTILKSYRFDNINITVKGMRMGILKYFLER